MLQVNQLFKTFTTPQGEVHAINNVTFSVKTGQFASIIGKSGSGKSTLLSLLGALDTPTSGEIFVDDVDIAKLSNIKQTAYRAQKIGFVFQQYNLIPNLSAFENVMLALEFGGVSAIHERRERATRLLEQVGITEEEQLRRPTRLSGGQQQRVSIARALANNPSLILADEPTGNLDSITGKAIFGLLHGLSREKNTTIIAVTHDLEIAGKTDCTFTLKDGMLTKENK